VLWSIERNPREDLFFWWFGLAGLAVLLNEKSGIRLLAGVTVTLVEGSNDVLAEYRAVESHIWRFL
jgi:hypothetical protein